MGSTVNLDGELYPPSLKELVSRYTINADATDAVLKLISEARIDGQIKQLKTILRRMGVLPVSKDYMKDAIRSLENYRQLKSTSTNSEAEKEPK